MTERQELATKDVVVIGAGPSGLAAAAAAAGQGCEVAVIDETAKPGGRLPGQMHQVAKSSWHLGSTTAARLVDECLATGVQIHSSTAVWGLDPSWTAYANGPGDGPRGWTAPAVVLATGATEVPAPVPGWTLPGVMTPGAMQTLVNVHGVVPGQRVLVAGIDPLGLEVAQVLALVGVEVVAVVAPWQPAVGLDASPGQSLSRLASTVGKAAPSSLLRAGSTLARNRALASVGSHLVTERITGLPLQLDEVLVAIGGEDRVAFAVLEKLRNGRLSGTRRVVEVDAVSLGGGLRPLVELTGSSGCELVDVAGLGGEVPLHGRMQQTTAPGLFVAGGASGVEGASVCEQQGRIAGLAAARHSGADVDDSLVNAAVTQLGRARREATVRFDPRLASGRRELQRRWEAQ